MRVQNDNIHVYFRIPFTMYFVCRTVITEDNYKSKLFLCTKRFDNAGYYWNVIK